jgi:hypothetical protein
MRRSLLLILAALAYSALEARTPVLLPDTLALGRDAAGEPCTATRNWRDARLGSAFDQAWSIACRGVSASRAQGFVLRLHDPAAQPVDPKACGPAVDRPWPGIGTVSARACVDPALGRITTLRFRHQGNLYVGGSPATALPPLQRLMRVASRLQPPDAAKTPPLDLAALPPAPAPASAGREDRGFNPAIALQTGTLLNQRGQYVEASRLLNDALSRITSDTAPATRIELELEAGLADSNISQFDAADDHFARATSALPGLADLDRAAALQSKRATYRGLDLINRRQWQAAIAELADKQAERNPLSDAAILARLNQPTARAGASAATSSANAAQLALLLLEAQRNWARSIALLAINDPGASSAALAQAADAVVQLQRSVQPDALVSIKARIQRQQGRIAARQGSIDPALAAFDCAIRTLQGTAPDPRKPCSMDMPVARARRVVSAAAGPMIAETELERASLLARKPGVPQAKLLADYQAGVDALIASSTTGGIVPPSMEGYLDLLVAMDAKQPSPAVAEQFFRALQAVGEPAIAQQLAQLQSVVTADSALGAKVRDRAEAERDVVRLRYAIASADPSDRAALDALERQRAAAEDQLGALNVQIAGDSRYRAVDDQPVTVTAVRRALKPGELYLKLSRVRSRVYGIAISADRSFIYSPAVPAGDLAAITGRVRASIRSDADRLPFFDAPAAYALFRLIAGPAEPALVGAKALVVDTAGVLDNLPAGVLVTDRASVARYQAHRSVTPNDYSGLSFLARRSDISNALSPRSFLIARALPPSAAPRPFIGLGQNAPPEMVSGDAAKRMVAFGSGCGTPYGELAALMGAQAPISAHEIGVAATALGDPQAPEITGRAFTDTAIMADNGQNAFARYQVIHFATHGLPETVWRCTVLPPSLVTTLAPPAPPGQPQSNGLLTFADVAQLHLDANLVVLSACETAAGVSGLGGRAAGQDESSASLDGLVRAFITANARAVLATYWKVPAIAQSEEFIRDFYVAGRSAPMGAALRLAQTALIRQPAVSHPYFWGAYFLVGDGSKTMLSPPPSPIRTAAR